MAGVSERRGGGGSTSEATSLPGGFSQPTVLIQPKTCRHDRTLVHCSCKEEIYIYGCVSTWFIVDVGTVICVCGQIFFK